MTASTANSGRAWSHARMARAIPCDTRNWAHSAAQEIRKAETTTAGKGQTLSQNPPGPVGAVPGVMTARSAAARQQTLCRTPSRSRRGAGRRVVGSLMGRRVYHAMTPDPGTRGPGRQRGGAGEGFAAGGGGAGGAPGDGPAAAGAGGKRGLRAGRRARPRVGPPAGASLSPVVARAALSSATTFGSVKLLNRM